MGDAAEHAGHMAKIARWYWCGIFGEVYGGAVESLFAREIVEVPAWLQGGREPTTVLEGVFRAERLPNLRTRLSAAYKGIHALLMREGARDFRTGQKFDATVFFDEAVDIHHIFPRAWCEVHEIPEKDFDNVINKTPLSYRTNRIIGGAAPSKYLEKLELGKPAPNGGIQEPPIPRGALDCFLTTHCIPVAQLRSDDFEGFMAGRREALIKLIAHATGHAVNEVAVSPDDGVELPGTLAQDDGLAIETA